MGHPNKFIKNAPRRNIKYIFVIYTELQQNLTDHGDLIMLIELEKLFGGTPPLTE